LRDDNIKKFGLKAVETLPEMFRDAGYQTGAVFANPWLSHVPGLRRGFDVWHHPPSEPEPKIHPRAKSINEGVLDFFNKCGTGPCFLFANYMDAHNPYIPPRRYASVYPAGETLLPATHQPRYDDDEQTLGYFAARYDEQILALDAKIGDLLNTLASRGILDDSWLIITADHGESFGEHGVTGHGTSLYNEQVRIPLIIRPPAGRELPEIQEPVSLVDITATLAGLISDNPLGIGRSLLDSEVIQRSAQMQFFGTWGPHQARQGGSEDKVRAVADGRSKLIDYVDHAEVFDLIVDAAEQNNLIHELSRGQQQAFLELMPDLPDVPLSSGTADWFQRLSEQQQDDLRSLGYFE
jgi:arylsulfatase A-like enzyme